MPFPSSNNNMGKFNLIDYFKDPVQCHIVNSVWCLLKRGFLQQKLAKYNSTTLSPSKSKIMKRNVRGVAVHWLTGYMVLDIFSVTSTCYLISNLTQKLRKMAAVTHARQWLGFYNKDDMFCHRLLSLKYISNKTIGPLQDPVTWYNITQYNITHAGEHRVALFCKSNCKIYLLTSMCVFVPFEQIMQRAIHWQHSDLWFT